MSLRWCQKWGVQTLKKQFMWKRRGTYVAGSSEEESRTLLYQYMEPTNALGLEIKSESFA